MPFRFEQIADRTSKARRKFFFSTGKSLILILSIASPTASYAIELDRIFWQTNTDITNLLATVIAIYSGETGKLYLIVENQTGRRQFLTDEDPITLGDKIYNFSESDERQIYLVGPLGEKARITVPIDAQYRHQDAHQTQNSENSRRNAVQQADRQLMEFTPTITSTREIRDIAELLGFPLMITNAINRVPATARSRSGRPGWLLDDSVPQLFYNLTPFQPGDIILSIDGISAHEVDFLLDYYRAQEESHLYVIEIERQNSLQIIQVSRK